MVRFRFRGFDRESGKPLEGYVEASEAEGAYQVLSDHGIVTDALLADPEPPDAAAQAPSVSRINDALESALDSSSSQVAFDDLTERYRGKKVWVIDREKIRQHVAQVVDSTLAASEANRESGTTARERVADAIGGLFHDARNVASQHDPQNIAKLRAIVGAAAGQIPNDIAALSNAGLAEQIGRLTGVVQQAEGLIAAMSAALRNLESGGAAPRRRVVAAAPSSGAEQDGVLREIFQSNLDLRRAMAKTTSTDIKAA
jgi:hypothetical protein